VIGSLEIENSKSIKHSKLDCRRINVFIGKPNTGVESNIIRKLGLLSFGRYGFGFSLRDFVRFSFLVICFMMKILMKRWGSLNSLRF